MHIDISKEDSSYMYDTIQRIIDKAGPRIPGSPEEAKGAEVIKEELEKTCDQVDIERFSVHPRAFLGWIRVDVVLIILSICAYYLIQVASTGSTQIFMAAVSVALMVAVLVITWKQFFNYDEFIDPLFKKKTSQNVVGKIKSKEKLEKIIIFSGHHDSALRFNLLEYVRWGYPIINFWGMIIIALWSLFSAFNFLFVCFGKTDVFLGTVTTVAFASIPVFIGLWFFTSSDEKANKVPGAVDNLSAVAVILGLGRYLKQHPEIIPPNTEIRLISFGSEEAGLRGAYRYAEAHLDELKKYDAEVVNMDGIQSLKNILVVEFEPTTRTQHSEEVVQKILTAAHNVQIPVKPLGSKFIEKIIGQISGGSDAAAFSKAKIKAATISAMDFLKFLKYYHQSTDTLDKIDRGALENCLKITASYLMNKS